MGIGVPSPCMHAALLGPCFKTGPSPSPTPGGRAEASARRRGSSRGRGGRLLRGGTPSPLLAPARVLLRLPCSVAGGRVVARYIARRITLDYTGHSCAARLPGLVLATPGSRDRGGGDRDAGPCGSSAPRSTPGVPPARYSEPATELRGRLHSARLDALLALLTECFSEFPHGTYFLSGSCFEI